MQALLRSALAAAGLVTAATATAQTTVPMQSPMATQPPMLAKPPPAALIAPSAEFDPNTTQIMQYRIRSLLGGCVALQYTTGATVVPYLEGVTCSNAGIIRFKPAGQGRSTLEYESTGRCATVARGVVFGPPRIDALPCDGQPDQLFKVQVSGWPGVSIRTINGSCWTSRGRATARGGAADFIEAPCRGSIEQRLSLEPAP